MFLSTFEETETGQTAFKALKWLIHTYDDFVCVCVSIFGDANTKKHNCDETCMLCVLISIALFTIDGDGLSVDTHFVVMYKSVIKSLNWIIIKAIQFRHKYTYFTERYLAQGWNSSSSSSSHFSFWFEQIEFFAYLNSNEMFPLSGAKFKRI